MSTEEQDIAEAEAEGTVTADPDGVADDPVDGEAPAEVVAADPAKPETAAEKVEREAAERKAARIKAADAVEAKAAARRAEMKKQRESDTLAQRQAEFDRQQAAWARQQAEQQTAQQSREQLFAKVRAGQAHPDEFLRTFGTTYADFTRQMLEANTPEAIAKAAQAEAAALRKRLDDRDAQAARDAENAQTQRVLGAFGSYVDSEPDAFPHAWRLPEHMLHQGALRISRDYARKHGGQTPTFEHVATELDAEAKSLHDAQELRASRARVQKPSNGQTPQASTPNGAATKPGTSTLTASGAGARVSPKAIPAMTAEEEYEWGLEQLRAARGKKASSA